MKPPIPKYIGLNMVKPSNTATIVLVVILLVVLSIAAYYFFTRKPNDGNDTV